MVWSLFLFKISKVSFNFIFAIIDAVLAKTSFWISWFFLTIYWCERKASFLSFIEMILTFSMKTFNILIWYPWIKWLIYEIRFLHSTCSLYFYLAECLLILSNYLEILILMSLQTIWSRTQQHFDSRKDLYFDLDLNSFSDSERLFFISWTFFLFSSTLVFSDNYLIPLSFTGDFNTSFSTLFVLEITVGL